MAYAASAVHLAGHTMPVNVAVASTEARATTVIEALLASAHEHPEGEQGVIAQWLPLVRRHRPRVSQMLEQRERRGW